MGHFRATTRIVGLVVLAIGLYLVFLAGLPFTGRWGAPGQRWRLRLWRLWSRAMMRLLRVRVELRGSPPRPPFLLVTNHTGYFDIVLLAGLLDAVFVSRADVQGWPFVGYFSRAIGTLFLDRARKRAIPRIVEGIKAKLALGIGVIFFPEGTSSSGDGVLPFRSPLLEAAVETGTPVSFAGLDYRTLDGDPPARQVVCWWGAMKFPGHFYRLAGLRGFEARVAFGDHAVREDDRKALAGRLQREVENLRQTLRGSGDTR